MEVKGKNEERRILKTKAQKIEIQWETQGSINSTNQNVPCGHVACGAATMQLMQSEILRVMYSP